MASAVEQLVNSNTSDTPVSFNDYYNAYGRDKHGDAWIDAMPDSLGARITNFFTGTANSAKQDYENYLADFEHKKNLKTQQAEWAREDSKVQRAVADIKKAGLNPWLALNGGSMSSAISASDSASVRYKAREQYLKNDKSNDKGLNVLGTALKIILFAAMMAA